MLWSQLFSLREAAASIAGGGVAATVAIAAARITWADATPEAAHQAPVTPVAAIRVAATPPLAALQQFLHERSHAYEQSRLNPERCGTTALHNRISATDEC